jgi:hypothetical protein
LECENFFRRPARTGPPEFFSNRKMKMRLSKTRNRKPLIAADLW